ncbi:MAG: TonB-dependent receptor [Alistipes sp.]
MRKILLQFVLMLTLMLSASASAFAQNTVVGRVVDSNGVPLVGVTVMVKDAQTGTATDSKGNYSIAAASTKTLEFSYLGYTTVEENVGKRTVINVKMNEEASAIGAVEVVSIGYGTAARRDLTGSVAKADLETIMKSNVTTFDQALGGRVAGVVVTTGDGALGAEANITIRGGNSLTQSNAPLYIIDGFPSESSFATALNPADIESIDILKDASSTAIYGARGANGVIVITTKKGQEGRPTVAFNASFTVNKIANKMNLMNPFDFVSLQEELFTPTEMTNSYFKDGYTLENYRHPDKMYDWQDEVYRSAFTQNYNISLSGGQNGSRYNVGMSVLDQDGIIQRSNFQRYQGKVNLTQPIGKKLQLNLSANYSRSITNGVTPTDAETTASQSGWLIYSIWGYRPVSPPGSDDLMGDIVDTGLDNSNDYRFNPLKTVTNEHRKTIVDYMNANLALTYTIIPGLKLRVTGGYVFNKRRREEFNGSETYTGYPGSPSGKGVNGSINWGDQQSWLNENTLTWNKRFARNHNIDLLGGITFQGQSTTNDGIMATKITSESLGLAGLYTGEQQTVKPYYNSWRMMSALFRLNYNYKYKYYLTASFRADGSSKFAKDHRWGYFPSVGVSWNFNRENLLKKSKWMSNGKLRASWGQTGNNRTSTPYDYYSQITVNPGTNGSFDYVFNGDRVPGYYITNMANPDLKWETTTQYNVGMDLGFFTDRIKITADWYLKDTKDLLLAATLPASSGYTVAMMNIGQIRNKGFEFSLETVNIKTRNFQWNTTFNISFNRNTVMALTSNQHTLLSSVAWETTFNAQSPYISQVGQPTGMMYGFLYDGTYKPEDFDGSLLRTGVPYLSTYSRDKIQPGDPKYRDMNGDGKIDENDRTIIGCGQPLHTGGFGNTFMWKNFDLNIFFSWSYGNDILNANRLVFETGRVKNTNQQASFNDRWTPANPTSNIPRANANGSQVYSSRVVEDGSFLRLKNVSLGYNLPSKALRKLHISGLRIFVSADNICTITNYSGPDPEVSTRNSVLTPGFDWSAYPRTFGITAGANITF